MVRLFEEGISGLRIPELVSWVTMTYLIVYRCIVVIASILKLVS